MANIGANKYKCFTRKFMFPGAKITILWDMKKILTFSAIALSTLMFTACGDNAKFAGCWQGDSNMIFEVLTTDNTNFTIRNINGDLKATRTDAKICGTNTLDMVYCMSVKGDSAYYEFGGITTGYKRIGKSEYDQLFAAQKQTSEQ